MLYAVCRELDDAVDVAERDPRDVLQAWRQVFEKREARSVARFGQEELAQEFLKTADQFSIPVFAMRDLIDKGVALDLEKNRFETSMDLEAYCYGVAGTVGLACLPIFGVPWQEAKEFAVRLGIAVQWTNTVRDVGADAAIGRIYLPLEHLERFGCSQSDLFNGKKSAKFDELMAYEAGVARSHYGRARELLPPRWRRALLPARIMGRIYQDLLEKIERERFPVFGKKISLSLFQKAHATWKAVRE